MAKTFRAVEVSTLSNNGQSTPKYNKPVMLNINYDPQGLSVELVSGTDAARDPRARGRFLGVDGPHRLSATRLIDHAIAAHPGDITTLTVDCFFSRPSAGRDRAQPFRGHGRSPTDVALGSGDRERSPVETRKMLLTRVLVFSFFSLSFFSLFIFHCLKHLNEKLQ